MKICNICGRENRDIAQFCRFCGSPYPVEELILEDQPLSENGLDLEDVITQLENEIGGAPETGEPKDNFAEVVEDPPVDGIPLVPDEGGQPLAAADLANTAGRQPELANGTSLANEIPLVNENPLGAEEQGQIDNKNDLGATVELPPDWQSLAKEETLVQEKTENNNDMSSLDEAAEGGKSEEPIEDGLAVDEDLQTEQVISPVIDEKAAVASDIPDAASIVTAELEASLPDLDETHQLPGEEMPAAEVSGVEIEKEKTNIEEPSVGIGPGAILQERYRILDILVKEDGKIVYLADDLQSCWSCQTLLSESQLRFCEMCGAELTSWPQVQLCTAEEPLDDDDQTSAGGFSHNGVHYLVDAPEEQEPAKQALPIFRYQAGFYSDEGQERDINEDSLLVLQFDALCQSANAPVIGFFAVADGMGGHAAGEVASRVAVHSLAGYIMEEIFVPLSSAGSLDIDVLEERLKDAVLAANQAVLDARGQADMGCTLTTALLVDRQVFVANVGDSRTYLMRNGALDQVTRDHSKVARMIEQNLLEPDAIYTHEDKGVVYRCLGDKHNLEVETAQLELELGDRLLLCSDGLWDMVRDPFIEDTLLEQFDSQKAAERLVDLANLSGGEDNISVIVVDIQALG